MVGSIIAIHELGKIPGYFISSTGIFDLSIPFVGMYMKVLGMWIM